MTIIATPVDTLEAATEDEGGKIVIEQSGDSKRAEVRNAIWKNARQTGLGGAGDIPTLNESGAVHPADGGTGLSLTTTALALAANNQSVLKVESNNLALGKVSYDSIDKDAFATEAEILEPDSSNPKIVTNVGLNDKIEEFEHVLGYSWGSWSATVAQNKRTLTQLNAASTYAVGGITFGIKNSSSFNCSTSTFSEDIIFATTACSGKPSVTPSTDFKGGVIFIDADGKRWFYSQGDDDIFNESPTLKSQDFFYRTSGGNTWLQQDYKGDELRTSTSSLPDDGKWYPISSKAHDAPNVNAFDDETFIAKRSGSTVTAMRVVYGSDDDDLTFVIYSRTFTGAGVSQAIQDGSIGSSKLGTASVIRSKIANDAVGTAQIDDAAVDTDQLADAAVETAKIANAAINTVKLQNGAVNRDKLTYGAVGTYELNTVNTSGDRITPTVGQVIVGVNDTTMTWGPRIPDNFVENAHINTNLKSSISDVLRVAGGATTNTENTLLTPASIGKIYKDLVDATDNLFPGWGSVVNLTAENLTNGQTVSNVPTGAGTITYKTGNLKTLSVSEGDLVVVDHSGVQNVPQRNGSPISYRYGLLAVSGSTRWFIPGGDNAPTTDSNPVAYCKSETDASAEWVECSSSSPHLLTSLPSALSNENQWIPANWLFVGKPGDVSANFELALVKRNGNNLFFLYGDYIDHTTIHVYTRDARVGLANTSISFVEETIFTGDNSASRDTLLSFSSGKAFADYDEVYYNLANGEESPFFSTRNLAGHSWTDYGGNRVRVYLGKNLANESSINNFHFDANHASTRIARIVGRKLA